MSNRLAPLLCAVLLLAPAAPASGVSSAGPAGDPIDAASEPGDVCDRGHTLYYWTLEDRFAGNESYRVLCEPAECSECAGGWKPVSVTMYLYWDMKNDCQLTVQAELWSAEPGADPSSPGHLLVASDVKTVGPFTPAGLWAVTVAMPPDSPIIDGPCYASIRFLDTCGDLPAMVAAPGACEHGESWRRRGGEWVDMADLDMPGNLSAYASFECQSGRATEPVAWGTIKSMYGAGD